MEISFIKELLQKQYREGETDKDALLERIRQCCFEGARLENSDIHEKHRKMSEITEYLGFLEQDKILCLSNELCYHYALQAFKEGFYAGLRLVSEIIALQDPHPLESGDIPNLH